MSRRSVLISRLRLSVHTAHRAQDPRAVGVLRGGALQHPDRGDPEPDPIAIILSGGPELGLIGPGARCRTASCSRPGAPRSRHLLRNAAHDVRARRQGGRLGRSRVRPRGALRHRPLGPLRVGCRSASGSGPATAIAWRRCWRPGFARVRIDDERPSTRAVEDPARRLLRHPVPPRGRAYRARHAHPEELPPSASAARSRTGRWASTWKRRSRASVGTWATAGSSARCRAASTRSVMALLVHRAVGDRLVCLFVDTGALRKNEADEVESRFRARFHLTCACSATAISSFSA